MATSEAPGDSAPEYQLVSATYQSPNSESFTLKEVTATPPTDKTAYLGALRKATTKMQKQINAELTARMEGDQIRESGSTNGASKSKGVIDEAQEEDNYGEEVAEED